MTELRFLTEISFDLTQAFDFGIIALFTKFGFESFTFLNITKIPNFYLRGWFLPLIFSDEF